MQQTSAKNEIEYLGFFVPGLKTIFQLISSSAKEQLLTEIIIHLKYFSYTFMC